MVSILFSALLLGSSFTAIAPDKKAEDLLNAYAQKISVAKSLVVDIEAYKGASSAGKCSFTFAKPGFVRIETPGKVQVLDGKTYTELTTKTQQYFTRPARANELSSIVSGDNTVAWSVFFTKDVSKFAKTATYDGKDTVAKGSFDCVKVTIDPKAKEVARLYIDPTDGLVKHVEFQTGDKATKTMVLSSKFEVDSVTDTTALSQMPSNAQLVAEDEMVGAKWYTDWSSAVAAARASNKLIMVDFYTDWCHWCKELDKNVYTSAEFRQAAKNFILCKIDAEKGEGVALAQKYEVNAYPMIKFINADGEMVHHIDGYMETAGFVSEMNKALGH